MDRPIVAKHDTIGFLDNLEKRAPQPAGKKKVEVSNRARENGRAWNR
jgi:hypothetical protein